MSVGLRQGSEIITGNIMIDWRALDESGKVVEDERNFTVLQKWGKSVIEQSSQLWAFIKSILRSSWGTYATQRAQEK